MDVLVLLEELAPPASPVADVEAPLAHVHSVPLAPRSTPFGAPPRDVVTLYGPPEPRRMAWALAAAVAAGDGGGSRDAVRHLAVWPARDAVGDEAWRDRRSGRMLSRDLVIPAEALEATAARLLADSGRAIRDLAARLGMEQWPSGTRRALHLSLVGAEHGVAAGGGREDALLDSLREADGYDEGD